MNHNNSNIRRKKLIEVLKFSIKITTTRNETVRREFYFSIRDPVSKPTNFMNLP